MEACAAGAAACAFRTVEAIDAITEVTQPPAVDGGTPDAAAPAPGAAAKPNAAELTTWLLEGRFFTVGPSGNVTSWSPRAADAFGWARKEILGEPLSEALAPGVGLGGYSGGIEARDSSGTQAIPAELAFVPIDLGVGYEFNSLLQDISARSTDAHSLAGFAKSNRQTTYGLVDGAWSRGQSEPAGWLVVFRAGPAAAAAAPAPTAETAAGTAPTEQPQPVADNVVSIADATGSEEARAQLERARRDADEGRVEIRSLSGQLEEARREAQRARQEVDVARQEAGDSRDALIVAQRESEEARRQLDDARRQTDEVRAAAEEARIKAEESQRDADSLREQLREARDSARGIAGRADGELATAQERAATLERSLAEARADAARHQSEVEPLRERYEAAQREVGTLRADLASARAERGATEADLEARLADAATRLEKRTNEAAALREELEARATEIEGLRRELDTR